MKTSFHQAAVDAATLEQGEELRKALAVPDPTSVRVITVFAGEVGELSAAVQILGELFPAATTLGCTTAGQFTDAGETSDVVVTAIAGDFLVRGQLAKGVAKTGADAVAEVTRDITAPMPGYPHRTAMLLLDPSGGNSEVLTLLTAGTLGPDVPLVGGAVGPLTGAATVALGGPPELDAIALAVFHTRTPLPVGVAHGQRPFSEKLTVTRAEGPVIHELEGKPAWDVWTDAVRKLAVEKQYPIPSTDDAHSISNFFLHYQAGLELGSGYKVRFPARVEANGAIGFLCEVPEGTVLQVMESDTQSQIDSARKAASLASSQASSSLAGALVFDCACRKGVLGGEFNRAVAAVADELNGVPLAGFETMGEIALAAGDMSGFHNTTTVVVGFPE